VQGCLDALEHHQPCEVQRVLEVELGIHRKHSTLAFGEA
jgi:hypothetical protein